MIFRLVAASFRHKPARSAFLLAGYGLGVAVTIALLSIGGALLEQSRDRDLVGGGDLLVLPAGLDLETFRTGGVSSLYFGIEQAPFLYRETLTGARFKDDIAAAAPWIENELIYLRHEDGWVAASADGMIPSAGRALGVEPDLTAGAWTDTPRDREWMAPEDGSLYASIDAFHAPPAAVRGDSTWAEWHYFNILLPDGWLYLTYMIAGDVPEGRWGGRMLATRVLADGERVYEATYEPGEVDFAPGRADLRIGPSSVRIDPDGVYRVRAEIPGAAGTGGARPLAVDLAIGAPVRKYLPPVDLGGSDFASGYVVPLLDARASGRVCRGGSCRTIEGARAYHDHNWGVWRDVTWEWGQANFASGLSLLYGVVLRDAVPAGSGFAYLFDDEGFAAVLPLDSVDWGWSGAGEDPRPERMTLIAARGRDTLRLAVEVDHARATVAGDGRSVFHQLRGSARATASLGGTRRVAEGEGFFETWSARLPE